METSERLEQLTSSLASRDRVAINQAIEALVADLARLGGVWKSLAAAASRNGEHRLALAAMERLCIECPNDPLVELSQAAFFIKAGQIERARHIIERLPAGVPSVAEQHYLLGTIALNQGRSDDARRLLTAASDADPASGQIWLALANTGSEGGSPQIGEAILAANHWVAASRIDDRAQYLHARGKVLADRHDHAQAFQAFDEAGKLLAQARPFNLAAALAHGDTLIEQYDQSLFNSIALNPTGDVSCPIFVTGMPRSGTTLVEQILIRSEDVTGGGELGLFRLLLQDIGGGSAGAVRHAAQDPGLAKSADLYSHLLSQRIPSGGRVVDKSLLAGNYMGLLMAAFPDAPIVWMRRDPIDNGWSCFRNYFVAGLDWSNSLAHIAAIMSQQERLLDHWDRIAPGRILVVDLEQLIANSEATIRAIARHCGVDFVPEMLNPERGERTVATASNLQVREAINRQGIGVATPYREYLSPFFEAYSTPPAAISPR